MLACIVYQQLLRFYSLGVYEEGQKNPTWTQHLIIAAKALPWDQSFFISYFNQYLSHHDNTKQFSAEENTPVRSAPLLWKWKMLL